MALIKTWYSPVEAAAKFGVTEKQIQEWVEQGLIRCEREGEAVTQVNVDDLRVEVENYAHGD